MSNPFCRCHEQTTKKITNKSNFIQMLHYSCKHLSWRKHIITCLTYVDAHWQVKGVMLLGIILWLCLNILLYI